MIDITAKMVTSLRAQTGAGMMNCKRALVAAKGNVDLAIELLRKSGEQIAKNKVGRNANQGLVGTGLIKNGDELKSVIIKINCETDFVAKSNEFQNFVTSVINGYLSNDDFSIDTTEIVNKIGENIIVNDPVIINGGTIIASYTHNKVSENLGSLAVLVRAECEPLDELAQILYDVAMHIAAANPKSISINDLDGQFIENERRIYTEQAKEEGKPDHIIERMVEGKLKKIFRDITLFGQPFVKDNDITIGKLLENNKITVDKFVRIEI